MKRHENTFTRAFVGRHFQQVPAFVNHFAGRHFVSRMAGKDFRQRRFSGTVRPHDGVNFALINGEVDPFENLVAIYRCM